jgi:hypothetical protein
MGVLKQANIETRRLSALDKEATVGELEGRLVGEAKAAEEAMLREMQQMAGVCIHSYTHTLINSYTIRSYAHTPYTIRSYTIHHTSAAGAAPALEQCSAKRVPAMVLCAFNDDRGREEGRDAGADG